MKKATLLLAALAFSATAFAQTTPTTEVKVRDNGTTKVVTKTGKTNTGQAIENTVDATGNVAKKTGSAIKRGTKRAVRATKRGTQKVGRKEANGTEKMETKTE